jgi:HK97 family phage portal protein
MSIFDRFRRKPLGEKAAELPFVSSWVGGRPTLPDISYSRMAREGYRANSAVNNVIQRLAIGYSEPPPLVMIRDEPRDTHPLQKLLNRPNPVMSHAELMTILLYYRAIGGNAYLHKVRGGNSRGPVVELWPYHAGQMTPIPSRDSWVAEYEYDIGDGEKARVPASEVIHLKWPLVDLERPWLALAPLVGVAREVDSDTEMTRYLLALLMSDAAPRGIIRLPEGAAMSPTKAAQLRAEWELRHGGLNRGRVSILEQGANYERVSLNMQELAWEALRRIPESRIAGAFGVPPILAQLWVGMERSTYANYQEARQQLTEDTYVSMWRYDGQELTQALGSEYGDSPVVTYDTGKVAALSENEDAKVGRGVQLFAGNIATKNEVRTLLGFDEVATGDVFADGSTPEALPEPEPVQPIIDVLPLEPPQLTDDADLETRQRQARIALKAVQDARTQAIEKRMTRDVAAYLERQRVEAEREVREGGDV